MTVVSPDCFETIAFVYSQTELAVLLSLLEHEQVSVVPIGRGHASVDWPITVALGGIELRVHTTDAARARALLAEIEPIHVWRGFFLKNRLLDMALIVLFLPLALMAPPARLPATFISVAVRRGP
ncbi:MAG TPA: hypothetical protein VEW04_04185 [Allosphingosinicella sp.]|nr:hypothetical protein [Allosphingosinicella sp.]